MNTCPNCGYCPHCGRGGYRTLPYYPTYPPYQPYWWGTVHVGGTGESWTYTTGGNAPDTSTADRLQQFVDAQTRNRS